MPVSQCATLIAAGRSNQEIAATLVLSVRTVERHISIIYGKIGASGAVARATITAYALRHGLAHPFPEGSFDLVLCQFALMFFTDRHAALNEMHRVLTKGGRVAHVMIPFHAQIACAERR